MTRVRPGRPTDLDALARAQTALTEPAPELLAGVLTDEGPGTILVAVDGVPVGYLLAIPGPGVVYVAELAVRPDCQRQGHGSALLSILLERTRDHQTVRLTVAADNEAARRFYDRHGFEPAERLEDHFNSGDGLVLVRPT
ncbi:MAG: acetyltransferase [halophilic archaeon J07HX64]|nr:MAG: acetyltransferase [halophilic archaeon J07HX64]